MSATQKTSMTQTLHLIVVACLIGFIGDALLQIGCQHMGGPTGWGLKPYFQQHGSSESLFIAGGMMTLFYIIYFVIMKLPGDWRYLIVYGILLDLIFRQTMLFESLKGYYHHLNYFWSGFWGAVPMLIPFLLVKYCSSTIV
jgi:hypothetical protein